MKAKRIISALVCAAILAMTFSGCSAGKSSVTFTVSDPGKVDIHTAIQHKFLDGGDYKKATDYVIGGLELSRPVPVTFEWNVTGLSKEPESYVVKVSENEDMSDAAEYKTENALCQVYNLKTGRTYFWNVTAVCGRRRYESAIKRFTTLADDPRNLYVDGITNVRDLGGWPLEDGGEVKQGLIYRCGTLSNSDGKDRITKAGKRVMLDELHVKSELDLRMITNGETGHIEKSPLGDDVNYYSLPMDYSIDMLDDNKEMIKKTFEVFADEKNYPMFFHCAIGTDRTGCVAFLLNALLGISKDDLYFDYMFSNYGEIGGKRDTRSIDKYIEKLERYGGETLSERVRAYLLDIGLTSDQLDFIVEKMTDK